VRFEVFMVVKIQVEVFWVVMSYLEPEDRGSMVLQNIGILPLYYMASQPGRLQIFTSVNTSHLA
jgi:hypothetical protein